MLQVSNQTRNYDIIQKKDKLNFPRGLFKFAGLNPLDTVLLVLKPINFLLNTELYGSHT